MSFGIKTLKGVFAGLSCFFLMNCTLFLGPSTSLYERLGGEKTVMAITSEWTRRLETDSKWNHQLDTISSRNFRQRVFEFICQESGGPCKYKGSPLPEIIKSQRLSKKELSLLRNHLKATLEFLKIEPSVKKEFLKRTADLRLH